MWQTILWAVSGGGIVDDIEGVNLPAVVLLALSGVTGMFFIVRWMVRYQREFTDVYVAENKKQRAEIDELKAEIRTKDIEAAVAQRKLLEYERTSELRIRGLELKVVEHEHTIAAQGLTISELSRRRRDGAEG